MRRGRNNGWLEPEGQFCGVNLGSDFVAEHEWGIDGMLHSLGVNIKDDTKFGLDRRRCKPKDRVVLKEEKDTLNLLVGCDWLAERSVDNAEWRFHGKDTLVTAWSEGRCIVRVKGKDNFDKLRQVYDAIVGGNAAVWLGGGGLLQNAGLCFGIIDKVPKESADVMRKKDEEDKKLQDAAAKTGVRKKIEDANEFWRQMREVETGGRCFDNPPHAFFSLRPKWKGDQKTKHPVVFWLSPRDESLESGTYTVEDLELWLQNKGPVVNSKRRKGAYS